MANVYKTERGRSKSPARLPDCLPSFLPLLPDRRSATHRSPPPHRLAYTRTQPALKIWQLPHDWS
ncbi:hypothetical protein E2C01_073699 [Portunus trituberculatus]|uniref:Uncharacterized protein n=1 Tax=Portunus trituberculatus TaxID=210409 RepID=A0A5B7IAE7_PORTR|nr:hypothetical protein [Portunus trituberculatus]